MNFFRRFSCAAFLLTIVSFAQATTPLSNVVSDRSTVILSLHDVPTIVANWKKSPWSKTWNDDQVKKFFAPLRDQMKVEDWDAQVKEKTGYTLTDLMSFATGDAIVAIPDFNFLSDTSQKEPALLLGIDVGSNAGKLEKLFDKSAKEENASDETSQFSGVTVHVIHPVQKDKDHPTDPMVWAIVEGKWFLSPSKDAIIAAIDAVHNGGVDNAWGRSERWANLQKRAGDSQVMFTINVEAIYPALKKVLDEKLKSGGPTATGPFAVDGETLLTALGLDAWRELYVTANLGEDSTDMHSGLSYSEQRGLTKLLAYHDGPVATPSFVSPKCMNVSTAKLSPKEAYASLEEMLNAVNPAINGLLQSQLRSLNKQLGIDLKRDFIGSLGDTVITARFPAPDAGDTASLSNIDQFFAVSLQDADTFSRAIDSFHRLMGQQADQFFKTRDFLGFKITTFSAGEGRPGAKPFHYAIAKGYFFLSVGSAGPMESALRGLAQDQDTIWKQKDVATALAQVPANASGFEYEDMGQLVASLFKTISDTSALMNNRAHPKANSVTPPPSEDEGPHQTADSDADVAPEPIGPEPAPKRYVDPSAVPDAATISKYWSYGWGYVVRDSSGIHATSKIVYPK
ncbi:MAG TPA: DUF3352 domain-containing protein [Opitutaceae bacterium]